MTGLSALRFVFGLMGIVAFVRTEKLIKILKQKGALDQIYQKK